MVVATERAKDLGRPALVSHSHPSNVDDPIGFFAQAADARSRALWLRPATGEALVGIGSARTFVGSGPARFRQVAAAWRELLADSVVDGAGGGPLLLGGFSFDPTRQPTALWAGFPSARMVLPERLLSITDGAALLTTNVIAEPAAHAEGKKENADRGTRNAELGLSPDDWQALVGTLADGIQHGDAGVRKVVLARAFALNPTRSIEAALRSLAAEYPSCTIFAFAHGDTCFLGATPERLISLHSGVATSMALAATAARGESPDRDTALAERLLGDPKERIEHDVVVSSLREGLSQVCTSVVVDAEPRLEKLSNAQHLLTSVRGQVETGRCVLDLVERLHPTPAVGGSPNERALQLIRQHEALDRGWYAGPLGWVNADGEGEFVVGLRCALVRGETAELFAGCGIVAGSNPAAEYAELGWKLKPMLAALAAVGAD